MRFHGHGDKVAYFFIAFSIYLVFRAVSEAHVTSLTGEALYLSIAASLLADNVPRVVDVPLGIVHPLRVVELFTFLLAVSCFLLLCVRRFLL